MWLADDASNKDFSCHISAEGRRTKMRQHCTCVETSASVHASRLSLYFCSQAKLYEEKDKADCTLAVPIPSAKLRKPFKIGWPLFPVDLLHRRASKLSCLMSILWLILFAKWWTQDFHFRTRQICDSGLSSEVWSHKRHSHQQSHGKQAVNADYCMLIGHLCGQSLFHTTRAWRVFISRLL